MHNREYWKREKKEKKKIFEEIMAKKLPDILENNLHIQEAQQYLSRIYSRRSKNRYIIVKMLKAKDEKTLKEAKEND